MDSSMTHLEKHIALVCNPTHSNAKSLRIADSIALLLSGMDIRHSIFTTTWPRIWNDITEVWIIGGDGTLNCFINQYPAIEIPLSIFPGGSGNDFHWMLYGDLSVEKQVDLVLEATAKQVDAGICNGQFFLNGVGIGFDGAIVRDLIGKKMLAGKASYLLAILKNIFSYQEKPCLIEFADETIEEYCLMISIANARRYGGGFMVAPKASVTDELLDLNIVGKVPAFSRMKVLPIIEKGEHLQLPFVQYKQSAKFRISSAGPLHCHIDGEYIQDKLFEIEILPKRFSFIY
jgi:diacylglycerol kinase (ATP)